MRSGVGCCALGEGTVSGAAHGTACLRKETDHAAASREGDTTRLRRPPRLRLDICLVLQPGTYQQSTPTGKRLEYLVAFPADVQVFQELPLYIRQRVLKEGRVLFCRDQDALYTLAFHTVQAFTDFQPLYRLYLEEMTRAGP